MSNHFSHKSSSELDSVVIRFAGDSGDGMQLTGTQFADTSALMGNDIATFPNYPSEIRAPQGSLFGVSGFQVQISDQDISTPGDELDLLVAMNPAALKTNLQDLPPGKMLLVDSDAFSAKNLKKAGYTTNPLEDGSLDAYRLIAAPMTSRTKAALLDLGMDSKSMDRSKNMFTLGMIYWIYGRSMDHTIEFFQKKFKKKPVVIEANTRALKAGNVYAENLELIATTYQVRPARLAKGKYRIIMGNQATAWGFIAAAKKAKKELFLGSYPITPASDILHELVKHPEFRVKSFQAEDEIAGVTSTIGASFAGDLAITTTSGPGLALKGEAIGLAMMTEMPMVIVDVQRGGPSTGLPTKTEQSDLLQALYGRNGESPVIVVAAHSPSHCFDMAFEASRLALEHMTPVILMTDGYIANGSEPWLIKKLADLPEISPNIAKNPEGWTPYKRDKDSLAREWAYPGMKGFEHRIGGLEKQMETGNVNMQPLNHQEMVKIRAEKVKRVENYIPDLEVEGAQDGDLLVVGWGGTYGALHTAVRSAYGVGKKVGLAHFNYINPFPKNTADVLAKFKKIVVCELNEGQLHKVLLAEHPGHNYFKYNKVQGLPFTVQELMDRFDQVIAHEKVVTA
ncbi:MAG TPA: 2-oxoacid:acceptor oxidoreductase subunit alpha [Saprospiraceae bacterium]|nr:2-oxoacid:acceptor oxidoreductase subunit alpha [Saprospiraceae bacterium]